MAKSIYPANQLSQSSDTATVPDAVVVVTAPATSPSPQRIMVKHITVANVDSATRTYALALAKAGVAYGLKDSGNVTAGSKYTIWNHIEDGLLVLDQADETLTITMDAAKTTTESRYQAHFAVEE